MDDTQRIVKCGKLSLHSAGGFFKKRWHGKYLVLYDGSKSGIKRLELFDSEIKFKKQNPAKIIPLVDCVRVVTCQRHKTTYTFEVRTSDQFYLLAAQSFQDMNDWVNCLRLVAFGQSSTSAQQQQQQVAASLQQQQHLQAANKRQTSATNNDGRGVDVLLEQKRTKTSQQQAISRTADYVRSLEHLSTTTGGQVVVQQAGVVTAIGGGGMQQRQQQQQSSPPVPTDSHPALICNSRQNQPMVSSTNHQPPPPQLTTASQAATAAASALAKTRQRQPSLLGSCKPEPPTDSPFIKQVTAAASATGSMSNLFNTNNTTLSASIGQMDTLTPTVRGQLISTTTTTSNSSGSNTTTTSSSPATTITTTKAPPVAMSGQQQTTLAQQNRVATKQLTIQATLDEEEENMLYCSIEDNPSEHNYRVKVIETELSLRCQLKCYQLTAPTDINQQYAQLDKFNKSITSNCDELHTMPQPVTFYQLIIGPQELTLLNDYAAFASLKHQQQGLWSWPYQCIRRYGFDKDNCFMFEAGRKCTSGPGQFIVQTPKAYNIYQDVVKFVNELRSLSTSQQDNNNIVGGLPTIGEKSEDKQPEVDKQQRQVPANGGVITQIPVTWAPHTTTIEGVSVDSILDNNRQQFFDTLRQLDSSSSASNPTSTSTCSGGNQTSCVSPSIKSSSNQQMSKNSMQVEATNHDRASKLPSSDSTHPPIRCVTPSEKSPTVNRKTCGDVNQLAATFEAISDESGYEQGDDSVDSSTMSARSKLVGGTNNRKRQANDSMSSSSSISSGGGSPGHSVSRRSNGVVGNHHLAPLNGGQGPCKRPLLNSNNSSTNANNNNNSNNKLLEIRQLLSGGGDNTPVGRLTQADDFETNLIRDVYSEITKLHAKFAVTSSSADDSMSSNSSQQSSEDLPSSNHSSGSNGEPEDGTDECGTADSGLGTLAQSEPMYTNLRLPGVRARIRPHPLDLVDCEEQDISIEHQESQQENRRPSQSSQLNNNNVSKFNQSTKSQQQQQQQQQQQPGHPDQYLKRIPYNSYAHDNFDYLPQRCGPIGYSGILNPIPECGEVAPSQPQPPTQISKPKPSHLNHNFYVMPSNQAAPGRQLVDNSDHRWTTSEKSNLKKSITKNQQNQQPKQVSDDLSRSLNKSKMPTNHYVINDVQYAKISRNLRSKYESCL